MSPPRMGAPILPTVSMEKEDHGGHPFGSGVDQPRKTTTRDNAVRTRHKAHSDQASQAAARGVILPISRCRSFVLSVTTPTLQHCCLLSITTSVTRIVF